MLPDRFWTANERGVRGGIESGFLSASSKRQAATAFVKAGDGFVFEIDQGMVNCGASIAWLSQYGEAEEEILFAPLTGLEMRNTRVDDGMLVIEVVPSVNLVSLTIEQVSRQGDRGEAPCRAWYHTLVVASVRALRHLWP